MKPTCDTSDMTLLRERVASLEAHEETNDKAIKVAAESLTDRLMHSNGLIEQMRGQAQEMARRGEVIALERRVEALERATASGEGRRAGAEPLQRIGMAIVLAIVAGAVALIFAAIKLGPK